MLMQFFKIKTIKLIRSIERYTKIDMMYVVRSGFWSLFNQGIGSLCSFVMVVLLANFLPKETFGQYRFVLSIISVLIIFTLPGLGTSVTRSFARDLNIDISQIVKIKIRWGFIGSLATLLVAGYYFYNGNIQITHALILSAFFLPFIEPYAIYTAFYKGKKDFKTSAIYESISRIFQALVIILAAFISKNILVILGAYFVGQIIARLFFYQRTLRREKLMSELVRVDETEQKATVIYGKHLSATQIVSTITGSIDKLLVWHFLGAEILAIYYVALTIPKNIVLLCNILPRIAFPKFAQNNWGPEERMKITRKLLLFFVALMIPAFLYVLLIPFVIPLIFHGYSASVVVALVLAFLVILSPLNAMVGQILQAKKSVGKIVSLQIIVLVVFVIAFLLLYQSFGASALIAALALVISEAAALLIGFLFIK